MFQNNVFLCLIFGVIIIVFSDHSLSYSSMVSCRNNCVFYYYIYLTYTLLEIYKQKIC